ncbi:helix-turn-helix domain-containing protein [Chitinophaga sp.]|uniref:winged helix-turn-helix transcriptional regulator n=1 Tax=Chitinophaga sp. TaxID=1869181 RepID=UPI0031D6E36F
MNKDLYKGCPVQFTMQFLAGKWQIAILWQLREKQLRFAELRQLLPQITDKVLMHELAFFTSKGIVEKKQLKPSSTRAMYALSPLGQSLVPVIHQVVNWGYEHLLDEKVSRDMYSTPVPALEDIAALTCRKGVQET